MEIYPALRLRIKFIEFYLPTSLFLCIFQPHTVQWFIRYDRVLISVFCDCIRHIRIGSLIISHKANPSLLSSPLGVSAFLLFSVAALKLGPEPSHVDDFHMGLFSDDFRHFDGKIECIGRTRSNGENNSQNLICGLAETFKRIIWISHLHVSDSFKFLNFSVLGCETKYTVKRSLVPGGLCGPSRAVANPSARGNGY